MSWPALKQLVNSKDRLYCRFFILSMVAHYWKLPVSTTIDLSTKTHAIINFSINIIIKKHINL